MGNQKIVVSQELPANPLWKNHSHCLAEILMINSERIALISFVSGAEHQVCKQEQGKQNCYATSPFLP